MRHLRTISFAMTGLGLALAIAAGLFGLGPTWTLTGLLLVIAGVVKIAMVALWRSVAGLGASSPLEDVSSPPAGARRGRSRCRPQGHW